MPSQRLSVLGLFLLVGSMAVAQLPAGNYTIDPSLPLGGTNYQTWAQASAALAGGVLGPGNLTFTVASTTFVENVAFPSITGTNSSTQVTFVAVGTPAVIDANGAQDGLAVQNAQTYLNFENLEIRNFTRYGLYLQGTSTLRSTFCTFKRIRADAATTTSSTVSPFRGDYANDCSFEDCVFKGGGYVLRTEQINRCFFRRCEFDGEGSASRLLAPFNSNDADNLWENCFLHSCSATGSGAYFDLSSYGNMFFHNTVIVSSSGSAVFLGSLTSWSRANGCRNNIIVNLGTGIGLTFGAATGVAPAPGLLECNDANNNCYWTPNGSAIAMQGGVAPNFVRGTLAQWQAFLAANPGIIRPAGGTSYDQNSIEADPLLASMTSPYDIHLLAGSPCRDVGTTLYVAGAWISYNQSYLVANDFEQDLRPAAGVDIGADEAVCTATEYETNSPASSLDIDGVQGSACSSALVLKTAGQAAALNFGSTNVGLGWEAVIAAAPLVPLSGGGIGTANGQILNVNFLAPVIIFFNGGAFPSFATPFPGNFGLGFSAPVGPLTVSAQMVNLDPSNPDGFAISQGVQLTVL